MKKFFCLLILAISFANVSVFGQDAPVTPKDKLADAIIRYNAPNGLTNPDSIWPGQRLYYYLPDGSDTTIFPVHGDNQTILVKGVIDKKGLLDPKPETNYVYNGEPYDPETIDSGDDKPSALAEFWQALKSLPMWIWMLLGIAIFIIVMSVKEEKARQVNRARTSDPITSGTPQVPGGVPDDGAHQRFVEIAEERFPSATFVVRKMYRGVLNGPAIICYGGEPSQEKILKNIDAYEGVTTINGKEESIFFLQGCGNDARQGNFMKDGGGLVFTRQFEILPDGTEIPVDADGNRIVPETANDVVEEKGEVAPPAPLKKVIYLSQRPVPSEFYNVVSDHNSLAEQILKDKSAHRVTIKVTTPEGTVETIYEAKVEPKQKNESSEGTKK